MSKLTDRVSYLRGLADGLHLNPEKDANRMIMEIINALDEFAEAADAQSEALEALGDYVESVDFDLAELEESLSDDEEEDGEEPDIDPEEIITYECPHCGHELQFRAADVDFDADCLCPACGKEVFPQLSEDEDGD